MFPPFSWSYIPSFLIICRTIPTCLGCLIFLCGNFLRVFLPIAYGCAPKNIFFFTSQEPRRNTITKTTTTMTEKPPQHPASRGLLVVELIVLQRQMGTRRVGNDLGCPSAADGCHGCGQNGPRTTNCMRPLTARPACIITIK